MAQRGNNEQAVRVLTYVLAQPACPRHVSQVAESEIEIVKTKISADLLVKAVEKFQGVSLDAVIDWLMDQDAFRRWQSHHTS